MAKVLSYEADIRGGVTLSNKLRVPVGAADPVAPDDGWLWLNTSDHALRYRDNSTTYTLGLSDALDPEQVRDIVGAALVAGDNIDIIVDDSGDVITIGVSGLTSAEISDFVAAARSAISVTDTATLDLTYTGGAISGAVLNSPQLNGQAASYYLNTDNHVDGTTNHVFTAADDTKLAGIATGATANAADAYLLSRANHTGTQTAATISDFTAAARSSISVTDSATADLSYALGAITVDVLDSPTVGGNTPADLRDVDTHTSGTINKVFTATEQTKLAGIATGATANQTDAYLLSRTNHTGTQTASTISDFTTAARAAISVTDTATADLTYAAGAISVDVLDSPLLEGSNKAYYRNVDNHVDGTTNHVFTAADDTKLAGIATGATANQTDAYLLARANHTGTQLAATISDLETTVGTYTIDAATLNGSTAAQLQTTITAAIVDTAPGTLDTLNELAAALGDDPNFATTVTTALNARSRNFAASLTGGTLTEVVTHNLNTRDLVAQVYVGSGSYEQEDYIVQHTTANTITIVSEGQNIPAGRRVVIHAVGT